MPRLSGTVSSISSAIVSQADDIGGELWGTISSAARHYVKGYSQSLIDISRAVAMGEMDPEDGVTSAKAATLFFHMMIAQGTQATLNAIQQFFDSVLSVLRDKINSVLPFPIL